MNSVFLVFLRHVDPLDVLRSAHPARPATRVDRRDFFFLRRHDSFQRGIARLVDARLNREHRRQRQLDPLKPAGLEFALQFQRPSPITSICHDDRRVRAAEQFGEQHAGLPEALIVALQAREDQGRNFHS